VQRWRQNCQMSLPTRSEVGTADMKFVPKYVLLQLATSNKIKKVKKVVKKLSKSCQKVVNKLTQSCTNCQNFIKKLSTSCQKSVKKLLQSCQKVVTKLSKLSKRSINFVTAGVIKILSKLSKQC
jgi:hypothetical protein